ncbi:hypothetical protein AA0498_2758 [Acidomonas methanolica]|uniref:Uncharacterized protein n=1 Tax=Acidomonas methanolica NBRC 104435 TaxID=1231351 RepID=A0A023D7N9_ACIMT|nr:hypothetical protein Amme_076_023 [Acidomonas methanolica NBRC 104435]GBQ59453.1 hypothetical protein AA0498_2758 [Acidomonas methanolica]
MISRYPRTLRAPDGYTTVTVRDAEQEARVKARFAALPAPPAPEAPQMPVTRRKGRPPNVRKH